MSSTLYQCTSCGQAYVPHPTLGPAAGLCPRCRKMFASRSKQSGGIPPIVLIGAGAAAVGLMLLLGIGAAALVTWRSLAAFQLDLVPRDAVPVDVSVEEAEPQPGIYPDANRASSSPAPSNVAHSPGLEGFASGASLAPLPPLPDWYQVASGNPLRYQWQPGKSYLSQYELRTKSRSNPETYRGFTSYRVTDENPVAVLGRRASEGEEGSGTAFVIHPDGLLVTCAHVVEDAETIQVTLGNETMDARLVALDDGADLALLKVDQTGMDYLPLGDSTKLLLAEELRALGYPLATYLGEGLKATRGELAGRVELEGEQLLQIDVSVNPGNSGGPVLNDRGQVVGVASALLAGHDVSSIGFAVPTEQLQPLLERNNIVLSATTGGERLSGPEVVQRSQAAVAFVRIRERGMPSEFGQERVVQFYGEYRQDGASSTQRQEAEGRMIVDRWGNVVYSTNVAELPWMQGTIGTVGIEPVSSRATDHWTVRRLNIIQWQQSARPSWDDRLGRSYRVPGRRGPGGHPFTAEATFILLPVLEQVGYEIVDRRSEQMTIEKTYSLRSLEDEEQPLLKVEGGGQLVFNTQRHHPERLEYQSTFSLNVDNVTVRIPMELKVSITLQDESTGRGPSATTAGSARPATDPSVSTVGRPSGSGIHAVRPDQAQPARQRVVPVVTGGGLDLFRPDE